MHGLRLRSQNVVLAMLCGAVCLLSGCLSAASLVEAMGKDPASICLQVNTVYGTARIARTNIVNGNVTCNGDGLTVKTDQPAANVYVVK